VAAEVAHWDIVENRDLLLLEQQRTVLAELEKVLVFVLNMRLQGHLPAVDPDRVEVETDTVYVWSVLLNQEYHRSAKQNFHSLLPSATHSCPLAHKSHSSLHSQVFVSHKIHMSALSFLSKSSI
jgi:hypothetical protein